MHPGRFFFTMAKLSVLLAVLFAAVAAVAASGSHRFSRNISPKSMGLRKEKKFTHFHFYFHDNITAADPTAVRVAEAAGTTNTSLTPFSTVFVMDDPLTEGPEPDSKPVGRAEGIYVSASKEEVSFLMVLTFAFTEGKYNGSNLSILGRNAIYSDHREMPIVGGSGVFRFAGGYAVAKAHKLDVELGNAVVEYNVYVSNF